MLGDVTLRSPLSAEGVPKNGAQRESGSTFHTARLDKARMYPELYVEESHFEVLVLGCGVGGFLTEECHSLIRQLVAARAAVHPRHLQGVVRSMYKRR